MITRARAKPYFHSSSGMCSKFMPEGPATAVGTARMAAQAASLRVISVCCA
jgi:hypothetical protein